MKDIRTYPLGHNRVVQTCTYQDSGRTMFTILRVWQTQTRFENPWWFDGAFTPLPRFSRGHA